MGAQLLVQLLVLIAVLGAAAFGAMLLAWMGGNRRIARRWAAAWAICIVAFGVTFFATVRDMFSGPSDATMAQLVRDLDAMYPNEIAEIDYENALPMDPPTLFIDVDRAMTRDAELRFICDQVKVKVDAVDRRIDVFSSGVTGSEDC